MVCRLNAAQVKVTAKNRLHGHVRRRPSAVTMVYYCSQASAIQPGSRGCFGQLKNLLGMGRCQLHRSSSARTGWSVWHVRQLGVATGVLVSPSPGQSWLAGYCPAVLGAAAPAGTATVGRSTPGHGHTQGKLVLPSNWVAAYCCKAGHWLWLGTITSSERPGWAKHRVTMALYRYGVQPWGGHWAGTGWVNYARHCPSAHARVINRSYVMGGYGPLASVRQSVPRHNATPIHCRVGLTVKVLSGRRVATVRQPVTHEYCVTAGGEPKVPNHNSCILTNTPACRHARLLFREGWGCHAQSSGRSTVQPVNGGLVRHAAVQRIMAATSWVRRLTYCPPLRY